MAYVFNGWLEDAASFAKSLVPSNTIVGKALAGDYKGAAQGTARLVSGATSGATTPRPMPAPYGGAQPGLFEPGGFVEKNQTVILLGAVGLVAVFVFMKKGRR